MRKCFEDLIKFRQIEQSVSAQIFLGTYVCTYNITARGRKIFDAGVIFLYFTGGEIFTRTDFLTIYKYAKRKGFIVELLTNGTLITQEAIDVFEELPPASISISMYGKDEESYQRVTGKKGMYNKVINTFELLFQHLQLFSPLISFIVLFLLNFF